MINSVKAPCDEGILRSKPVHAPSSPHVGVWILVATILGSSMAFIDGSVVNVALPVLQRDLNATSADVQWVVQVYSLFLSTLILVGGSFGRPGWATPYVCAGRACLFALFYLVRPVADDYCSFIIARAVQGIGGALLVPGSLAIISASFDEQRRGQAIGTWSGFTSVTSVIGPVLGGWLIQVASWRWVFFLNVPLAVIVLFVTFWRVPESRHEGVSRGLDWRGAGLSTIGLGGIVYGLTEARTLGLSHPLVLGTLAVGIIALIGVSPGRGTHHSSHGSAHLVSLSDVQRHQSAHIPLICGSGRSDLLLALQPDSSAGILDSRSRCRPRAICLDDVPALALDRGSGETLRREAATDRWTIHHGTRLPALCRAGHRRHLLDDLLPRRPGDEPGHGDYRCAADHNGDERGW